MPKKKIKTTTKHIIKQTVKMGDAGEKLFTQTNDIDTLKAATAAYSVAVRAMMVDIKRKHNK